MNRPPVRILPKLHVRRKPRFERLPDPDRFATASDLALRPYTHVKSLYY